MSASSTPSAPMVKSKPSLSAVGGSGGAGGPRKVREEGLHCKYCMVKKGVNHSFPEHDKFGIQKALGRSV